MKKFLSGRLIGCLCLIVFLMMNSMNAYAGSSTGEAVRLKKENKGADTPFMVENMLPGDKVSKDFIVTVKHKKPVVLYYHAGIQQGYEKLAEVLKVKIMLPDKGIELYDGLMKDMPEALEHSLSADEKEVLYRITAYLDTSVGNEYQYKSLKADFKWWYAKEAGSKAEDTDKEEADTGKSFPSGTAPKTGDTANAALYILLLAGSAVAITLLYRRRRRDG